MPQTPDAPVRAIVGPFDADLVESTTLISDGSAVDVYKLGGGTLGGRYAGLWGYRLRRSGRIVGSGESLRTGIPSTHDEVAQHVLDSFASTAD